MFPKKRRVDSSNPLDTLCLPFRFQPSSQFCFHTNLNLWGLLLLMSRRNKTRNVSRPSSQVECMNRLLVLSWILSSKENRQLNDIKILTNNLFFIGIKEELILTPYQTSNHQSTAHPSKRILQYPGQFAVSVRHTRLVVVQRINHIGQCKQGLVDLGTLLEANSFIAGSSIILIACFAKKIRKKH